METWNLDRWLAVTGLALAVIGLVTGYYFYRQTKTVYRLSYSRFKSRLIDLASIGGVEHYKVFAGDMETEVLFREYILFQNTGNKSFVFKDQLKGIHFKTRDDTVIFVSSTTHDNEARERFKVVRGPKNCVEIQFEFLRRGEAVLFTIEHNCRAETDLRINSIELDTIQHKKLSRYIYGVELEQTLRNFLFLNMMFSALTAPIVILFVLLFPSNSNMPWWVPILLLLTSFVSWLGWWWSGKAFGVLPNDVAVRTFYEVVRHKFRSK